MDNRVSNNPVRVPTNNTVANAPRVPDQFTANATVNTSDAASFSSQASTGSGLDALTAAVSELETRIRQLEARVTEIAGSGAPQGGTVALPPGMNLPAFPGSRSNAATIPTNNGAIPNAPANNFAAPAAPLAPANNFAAPQPPANNFLAPPPPPLNNAVNASVAPVNNVAANNAPVNNVANNALLNYATASNAAINNAAANNAPANNDAMLSATSRVAAAPSSLESDLTSLRSSLSDLQGQVRTSMTELDRLLRVAPSPETAAKKEDAGKAKDGLDAVESVLRHVKPGSYTPEEEAVVKGAVQRVNQIGREIAKGKDPAEFAPELFSLKHVIIDPAGAGTHQAVTTGAQILAQINELQGGIVGDLQKLAKTESKGKLTTEQKAQKVDLTQRYNALTGIQTALDTAKLTRLTATGDKVAVDSVNRLGDLAEAIGSGDTSPVESQEEVFRLGQLLRNPNKAPDAGVLGQGADAVKQIQAGQEGLHARLRELDAQVMAGQPAEAFAAERARLLASAEALGELGAIVTGAKLEQSSPGAKREIAGGLAKSVEIAKALAEGESPAKFHTEIFVLKQTLQEPLASKENPAIQSVAATLQLIGRAEAKGDKQRAEIAAKIAGGAAPRDFDAKSTALHRGAEDLESMRKALTSVDFGGLTPEQEAHGAKLADKMRDVTIKVASGEDFGKHRKTYEDLAAKLADLRNWKPAAPAPTPASPTPVAPAGPEAGSMYAVKPGDFLTKIATEQLGDSNLWKDIVALNKDKYPSLASNPDMIHPGWMLVLPKGGAKPAVSEPKPGTIPTKPTQPAPTPASNDPVTVGAGEPGTVKPAPTKPVLPKPTKPKPVQTVSDAPKPAGGAKYTVKNGDFLAKIAKDQLGDATRFREIVELNKAKYPSLAKNPDLIQAGWVLTMPGNGKPTPTPPKPPSDGPTPKPKPTPVPTPPVAPTPQPTSDKDAVSWLKANLGDDQRISRAEIEKMPAGPGKTATLEYFDALMFGYIDSGTDGWSNLFAGDVRKMEDALAGGQGIETLAKELSARILKERKVGDLNKDGTVDAKDLKLHAEQLRAAATPAPKPAEPPKPTKPEAPASDKVAQQRKDLDAYLNEPDNGNDSETTLHLLRTSPQYAEIATPAQKARLIKLALDGSANTQERAGALQVIEMAAARKELPALIESLSQQKALKDTMSDLGDNAAGQKLAKLFLENGLYKNETVWKAMDDDAAVGLLKAVGFSHPMIGTNDQLRELPEAAKHHMIKQLVGGNVTWTELYMARWLNQHTEIPYRIPDFNNN